MGVFVFVYISFTINFDNFFQTFCRVKKVKFFNFHSCYTFILPKYDCLN